MEPKKIALLVGALIVACVTAFMARSMFTQSGAPKAAAVTTVATGPEILVATRALPVGTIIEPDSFRYQPWPKELIQNAYYLKGTADLASLSGTVVRTNVSAGQPVTQGSLVKPGDRGFLAAALGPGMRAVTVSVSRATGVAGFVFPGDRVDLVLTQSVDASEGPSLKAAETIIRNIRVLATDQRTVSDDAKGNKEVKTFDSVTLEVTPRIAEKIAVAQTIGQLSLSLRSIADNAAELDRAIAAGEVQVPSGTDPKADPHVLIASASRPLDTSPTYVTGADVSRFQRRSVPAQGAAASQAGMPPAMGGSIGKMMSSMIGSLGLPHPGGVETPAAPQGPVIRVARGNIVTVVPTEGK